MVGGNGMLILQQILTPPAKPDPCPAAHGDEYRDIVNDSLNQYSSRCFTACAAGANRMARLLPGRSFLTIMTVITAAIPEQASLLLTTTSVRTLDLVTFEAHT